MTSPLEGTEEMVIMRLSFQILGDLPYLFGLIEQSYRISKQ